MKREIAVPLVSALYWPCIGFVRLLTAVTSTACIAIALPIVSTIHTRLRAFTVTKCSGALM